MPSRNLHPLMVPPFLQPHPDLQSAVGNAPLSSKHPTHLPTTDCLLSITPLMGGQPSDAPALSPPSPLQQGGQSSNAPALSPPSPLPQGSQPIALALSPSSPPSQDGQPSDAPGLSPSSSTLLLCPSDSTLSICHLNSQSAVKTGQMKWLVNSRTLRVQGRPVGYLNDLTIARDGRIFFTSSSSLWSLAKDSNILFEAEKSGRVLVYDSREKKAEDQVKEVITQLAFPNGIQLSKDEDYLLIAEGSRCRIIRAWIGPNSPKRNTVEEFAPNLPGIVDNVRLSPRGTFWVGVSQARHDRLPAVLDKFGDQPRLRAILVMVSVLGR
ncbi:hypothetical protein ACOMHN_012801 [Nucella lapillus]